MSTKLLEREIESNIISKPEITYEKLDTNNEDEVVEFEKALYEGYSKDYDGWIFTNYIKIGNRLKHIFPYKDLIIYTAKLNNKIVGGMSGHLNPASKLQVEMMGFDVVKDNKTCEGLTIFVNIDYKKLEIISNLGDLMVSDIIKKGYKKTYGTTNETFVNFHVFVFDWEKIGKKIIKNECRYLLKKEFA